MTKLNIWYQALFALLLLAEGPALAASLNNIGSTTYGNTQSNAPTSQTAGTTDHGRASTTAKVGSAGFDFTKIDADGQPLPKDAARWSCVRDNVTGLLWEVKSDDGGLHDKDWTYSWYNSSGVNDGGFAGYSAGGFCGGTVAAGCDTEKFTAAVNATKLCGVKGWRLPSRQELLSIADNSQSKPAIDTKYFPNTTFSGFWSSSPFTDGSYGTWGVGLDGVYVYGHEEDGSLYILLVHGGQ